MLFVYTSWNPFSQFDCQFKFSNVWEWDIFSPCEAGNYNLFYIICRKLERKNNASIYFACVVKFAITASDWSYFISFKFCDNLWLIQAKSVHRSFNVNEFFKLSRSCYLLHTQTCCSVPINVWAADTSACSQQLKERGGEREAARQGAMAVSALRRTHVVIHIRWPWWGFWGSRPEASINTRVNN